MQTIEQKLDDMRCQFVADKGWACEDCRSVIPVGSPPYWVSDGGHEPRDGTYLCEQCARRLCEPA